MLEGGALVLADQGICLIDEFDKMNEVDRTSIHEAMEQQSISISKAGIVANLPARCSVIAAANPIRGTYDNQLSFQDNLNLSEPILSRFDVLCVLKDEINFAYDKQLANFIINSHARSHPDNALQEITDDPTKPTPKEAAEREVFTMTYGESEVPRLSQAMLKKYILFAKSNFRPKLTDACRHKLQNFYVKLRAQSQAISGITIVVRHLESMIRFAEASAKMHLRTEVIDKDVDIAIDVLLKSFLQSTKPSIARNLERKFAQELNAKRNIVSLINHLLNGLVKNQIEYLNVLQGGQREGAKRVRIQVGLLEEKCREHGIDNLEPFFRSDTFKQTYQRENDAIIKDI
jgi:DNA replication licensing factor MCM2